MASPHNVRRTLTISILLLATSCATYYQRHYEFNAEFEKGDLSGALEVLQKNESLASSKTKFLYFVNNGLLLSIPICFTVAGSSVLKNRSSPTLPQ